jgi:hypothetical protein
VIQLAPLLLDVAVNDRITDTIAVALAALACITIITAMRLVSIKPTNATIIARVLMLCLLAMGQALMLVHIIYQLVQAGLDINNFPSPSVILMVLAACIYLLTYSVGHLLFLRPQ